MRRSMFGGSWNIAVSIDGWPTLASMHDVYPPSTARKLNTEFERMYRIHGRKDRQDRSPAWQLFDMIPEILVKASGRHEATSGETAEEMRTIAKTLDPGQRSQSIPRQNASGGIAEKRPKKCSP